MFKTRSHRLERIDTGDYTPEEYERFLREIRLVNRLAGDNRALGKTLLRDVENSRPQSFSVLDVGAGSGELLRAIARFAKTRGIRATLFGLELNARSARAIREESVNYAQIAAVRGDAFRLPFADGAFDYAICSLFTHHFSDADIARILAEMSRVARRGIYVIDLHRHRAAYLLYQLFCRLFRISPLVREDGSLSILRAFTPDELEKIGRAANLENCSVERIFPFRLILKTKRISHEQTRNITK